MSEPIPIHCPNCNRPIDYVNHGQKITYQIWCESCKTYIRVIADGKDVKVEKV